MSQPIASYAVETNDADQTRALGEDLGRVLAAGDLVMLSGGLGAGKTTLTQGIGVGMGVRGRVASPTFIVARVHPNLGGGPDLIHADAYRITDLNDLETLDLTTWRPSTWIPPSTRPSPSSNGATARPKP